MARIGWTMATAAVACTIAYGCASTDSGKGAGSETHFACERDDDCPSQLPYCVEEECSATPATCSGSACTDAQAPESDAATSDGAGPDQEGDAACGTLPPAQFSCVQFCGTDRPDRPLECRDGTWQCPETTPVRRDQCPDDTCWFPGANCCNNEGELVPGSCPGGREMLECPPGTSMPDGNGDCTSGCAPPTNQTGSMEVSFRFTNESDAPVALWDSCVLAHRITGCADGFEDPLLTWTFCSPTCPADGCPTCGGCADSSRPITANAPAELDWAGTAIRLNEADAPPGCACSEHNEVSPGTYRITVPVFSEVPQQMPGGGHYRTPLYEVTTEFTLPDEDGVIEVPIDDASHFAPCPGPGLCVRWQGPDTAAGCQLETPTPDRCPASAPRQFRCDEAVPLDPACVDPSTDVAGFEATASVMRCCPE